MNAKEILAIPLNKPERLYSNNLEEAKLLRNQLAKQWHPDLCKESQAAQVLDCIQKLYDAVVIKINNKSYGKNFEELHLETLAKWRIHFYYYKKHTFPLGTIYYNRNEILWHLTSPHKDLNSIHSIIQNTFDHLPKPDYKTTLVINQNLPTCPLIELNNGHVALATKFKEYLLLKDVIGYFDRPEHVGWALNRVYENLIALHTQNIYIGDLSPTNLWVDPFAHKIIMINGFWFGGATGMKHDILPKYCLDLLPKETIKTNPKLLDQYLVKRLGRLLLGDVTGMSFKMGSKVPKQITKFLTSDPLKTVSDDYLEWKKVLQNCFGDPKFIEMNVDLEHIYGD